MVKLQTNMFIDYWCIECKFMFWFMCEIIVNHQIGLKILLVKGKKLCVVMWFSFRFASIFIFIFCIAKSSNFVCDCYCKPHVVIYILITFWSLNETVIYLCSNNLKLIFFFLWCYTPNRTIRINTFEKIIRISSKLCRMTFYLESIN